MLNLPVRLGIVTRRRFLLIPFRLFVLFKFDNSSLLADWVDEYFLHVHLYLSYTVLYILGIIYLWIVSFDQRLEILLQKLDSFSINLLSIRFRHLRFFRIYINYDNEEYHQVISITWNLFIFVHLEHYARLFPVPQRMVPPRFLMID